MDFASIWVIVKLSLEYTVRTCPIYRYFFVSNRGNRSPLARLFELKLSAKLQTYKKGGGATDRCHIFLATHVAAKCCLYSFLHQNVACHTHPNTLARHCARGTQIDSCKRNKLATDIPKKACYQYFVRIIV